MKNSSGSILFLLFLFFVAMPGWGQTATPTPPAKYTKEQIEAIKAQNAKAQKINGLITQANTAMTAHNWAEAIAPLQQLTTEVPDNWQFYSSLGDAQLNAGDYNAAVQTYNQGIALAGRFASNSSPQDSQKPFTDPLRAKMGEAKMLTNQGNCYLKLRMNNDAVAAYTKAAELDPNPAIAYFNLCATQYNTGNIDGALAACDKAIAADPSRADAYFIKASLLFAEGKVDRDGKLQVPPGAVEALQKYLALAPQGPHANDVKQMLDSAGAPIETTYQKKK